MNETNNHLIAALNACIEDLVAKAIEKQLNDNCILDKTLDEYIRHSSYFNDRVIDIVDTDREFENSEVLKRRVESIIDAKADDTSRAFQESVREVVRNMEFTIEVGTY